MDDMRKSAVDAVTMIIAGREDTLIPGVEEAIRSYIAAQERLTCLTIVSRGESGDMLEVFAPRPPDLRYVRALTAFVLKRDFEGRKLDSILSEGTAAKVADVFAAELASASDKISDALVPFVLRSEVFVEGLSSAVIDAYQGGVPAHMRRQVTTALTGKLKTVLAQHIDSTAIGSIKAGLGKTVGSAVATPVGAKLAAVMVHTLATSLKPIIIKILSSTALKAAIATKLKAVVIGSFLGAFVKLLAVKLGLSTAATVAWILLPILVAWLSAEAYRFPGKLADSVADAVGRDMRAGFQQTSRSTAEMIVEMAASEAIAVVARSMITDDDVAEIINRAIQDAA
jgi:hypothetical protein